MGAPELKFQPGDLVRTNYPMPIGGTGEVWRILSFDDCHYWIVPLYTFAARYYRIPHSCVRAVDNWSSS